MASWADIIDNCRGSIKGRLSVLMELRAYVEQNELEPWQAAELVEVVQLSLGDSNPKVSMRSEIM